MSYFFYVSHKDPVHGIIAARNLMECGHFPFVPQLNKLIPGRKDEAWENYFKMWLFRCDAIFLTESFRQHELDWAESNEIPVVRTQADANSLELSPFIGVGTDFGKELAARLPADEAWRKESKDEAQKALSNVAGLGADPLAVGLLALKAWDRSQRR